MQSPTAPSSINPASHTQKNAKEAQLKDTGFNIKKKDAWKGLHDMLQRAEGDAEERSTGASKQAKEPLFPFP